MASLGRVDLQHSHREYINQCYFWIRDERDSSDINKWIVENQASGYFLAKDVSPQVNRANNNAGVFYTNINTATIETVDDVEDISKGTIIKFDDELWIVTDVQKVKHKHQSFYSKIPEYTFIINMRN